MQYAPFCRCHKMPARALVIANLNRPIKRDAVCRILIRQGIGAVILYYIDILGNINIRHHFIIDNKSRVRHMGGSDP